MAAKVEIPPNKWICTRAELIDLFDLHWMTHQSRFVSPGFPKDDVVVGRNQYDIKAYIKWLINVHYAANDSTAMAKEKLRHEKYKADKAQYDAEERIKQLLSRDEVISGLSLLLSGIKNKFLAWVKRLPPLMANKSTRDIEPILQAELYQILSDLAGGIRKIAPPDEKAPKKTTGKTPIKAKKPGRPKGSKNKPSAKKPRRTKKRI